ncbi:hypothetical protein GCM10020331_077670 [Ectobacillus funiculus]
MRPIAKKGTGRLIVETLEQAAIQRGLHKAKLHAQTQAEGFYQKAWLPYHIRRVHGSRYSACCYGEGIIKKTHH